MSGSPILLDLVLSALTNSQVLYLPLSLQKGLWGADGRALRTNYRRCKFGNNAYKPDYRTSKIANESLRSDFGAWSVEVEAQRVDDNALWANCKTLGFAFKARREDYRARRVGFEGRRVNYRTYKVGNREFEAWCKRLEFGIAGGGVVRMLRA